MIQLCNVCYITVWLLCSGVTYLTLCLHLICNSTEHVIGIIVSLIKNLPFNGDYRLRLLSKFIENDYEKVNRLLELRDSYEAKVAIVDREITRTKQVGSQYHGHFKFFFPFGSVSIHQ